MSWTKEQKLEMLSKAIDAGCSIQVNRLNDVFEKQMHLMDQLVGADRSVRIENSITNSEASWITHNSEDNSLSITLFFDSVQKEAD